MACHSDPREPSAEQARDVLARRDDLGRRVRCGYDTVACGAAGGVGGVAIAICVQFYRVTRTALRLTGVCGISSPS